MMFRLGLTGSIATGKSTVLAAFDNLGVPVRSADTAVHELYQGAAVAPVAALFPGVAVDGRIDRQRLARALADNPERLADLEALVHPLVRARLTAFLDAAEADGSNLAVIEIPLLFESEWTYPLDAVAVTFCSEAEMRARALARPGMTVEKLETILARQMPQPQKMAKADFLIDTGVEREKTRARVAEIVAHCRTLSSKRCP